MAGYDGPQTVPKVFKVWLKSQAGVISHTDKRIPLCSPGLTL